MRFEIKCVIVKNREIVFVNDVDGDFVVVYYVGFYFWEVFDDGDVKL